MGDTTSSCKELPLLLLIDSNDTLGIATSDGVGDQAPEEPNENTDDFLTLLEKLGLCAPSTITSLQMRGQQTLIKPAQTTELI